MKKYETFDHTADLGIRIFGRSYEEVMTNAAYALFDLLTDLDRVQEAFAYSICVEAADPGELLVCWLSELLFLFESQGTLFKRFQFSHLSQRSLQAVAHGEIFTPSRHEFKTEIKAVTYHQAVVRENDGRWEGRVIFDI